jgi:lysyl-tRNA synthetase class I
MRWAYEKVDFEPAGKDHHSQGGSFDTSKHVVEEVYGRKPPVTFRYDFIGIKGSPGKMSSSKGKVVDLYDLLRVYQPEIVRYLFAGTRPNTEFVISFDLDVIKIYEDYDRTERIYWGVEKAKNEAIRALECRIYELSQVDKVPDEMPYQIPFRHLCNLLQIHLGDVERFADEILCPGFQCAQLVFGLGRDHENRKISARFDLLQVFHHLESVHAGHEKIEQDQVVTVHEVKLTDLARIHRARDVIIAGAPQYLLEQEDIDFQIVDDQDFPVKNIG